MGMNKAKKMKGYENTQLDRLSDLPDALIQRILSFLDTKYAIQTCVLSKRWVNLWSDLPGFNFYCHHSTSILGFRAFNEFITNVLDHCKTSQVIAFRLSNDAKRGDLEQPLIDKIVNFAVSDSLQELDLSFSPSQCGRYRVLPPRIFSCQSLKILKLRNFSVFGRLPNYQCVDLFPSCINLQHLFLENVYIDVNNVFNIAAPQLVNLTMLNVGFCKSNKVVLSAPKLTSFHLSIRHSFVLSVDNSPFLDKLNVSLSRLYNKTQHSLWVVIDILRELGNAKSLIVSPNVFKLLSKYYRYIKDQPSPFKSLESLTVAKKDKSFKISPQVMNFLIQDCPLADKGKGKRNA